MKYMLLMYANESKASEIPPEELEAVQRAWLSLLQAAKAAGFKVVTNTTPVGPYRGAETQEMLDYCAVKNITAEVEVIAPDYINKAFERTLKGDVHYRFVIDMSHL